MSCVALQISQHRPWQCQMTRAQQACLLWWRRRHTCGAEVGAIGVLELDLVQQLVQPAKECCIDAEAVCLHTML